MAGGGRQERGNATRAEILAVARRLFGDFGYHNTGISDIQSATGLTKGAFYHHFRGKQELGLAVVEAASEDYARFMIEPAMAESTAGRRLARMLDCVSRLNNRPDWQNCRLLATLSAEVTAADGALGDAVRRAEQGLLDTLIGLVGEAQAAGEAAGGDAEVWAQLILSTMIGLVLIRKLGLPGADHEPVLEQLRRAILPGVEVVKYTNESDQAARPSRRTQMIDEELY